MNSPTPKTYLIGQTQINDEGLAEYLRDTQQQEFLAELDKDTTGLGLCSFYAKLCYKSLVEGRNSNVTRIRAIADNIASVFSSGHGSVFEHYTFNFVTTNCSRVHTHELVRHRVGTAYSQTSGRYCSVEDAQLILPPELDEIMCDVELSIAQDMRNLLELVKRRVASYRRAAGLDELGCDFNKKKRLTSAFRRIMPNGCDNEIGWSMNIRTLRHVIELRTSEHAEWEIQTIMRDVADMINEQMPWVLYGGKKNDKGEWKGLHV